MQSVKSAERRKKGTRGKKRKHKQVGGHTPNTPAAGSRRTAEEKWNRPETGVKTSKKEEIRWPAPNQETKKAPRVIEKTPKAGKPAAAARAQKTRRGGGRRKGKDCKDR